MSNALGLPNSADRGLSEPFTMSGLEAGSTGPGVGSAGSSGGCWGDLLQDPLPAGHMASFCLGLSTSSFPYECLGVPISCIHKVIDVLN